MTRDGASWCFLAIERGKQGYGATPVHMAGLDWRRTANSMFDAFRVHGLRSVAAEMASLERAFFLPDDPTEEAARRVLDQQVRADASGVFPVT